MNSLVQNPEKHYANLHSRVNPGGVVRSQLLPANTAAPASEKMGHWTRRLPIHS